jgi:hypothetical protein
VTVLASRNGRRFEVVRARTRRRASTLKADPGSRYVLYAAAQDRAGNAEAVPMVGDLLAPALRARRRGSAVVVRTQFFVQRSGPLKVSARGRRRGRTPMLRGSRLGATRLRAPRRTITGRALDAGPVSLIVRLRAGSLRSASTNLILVRGGGSGGGTLHIPFRMP